MIRRLDGADHAATSKIMKAYFAQPQVFEALLIAAPELAERCRQWLNDELNSNSRSQDIETGLMRYLSRMTFRATPFGLFAGYSVGEWQKTPDVTFYANQKHLKRRSRLNIEFIYQYLKMIVHSPTAKACCRFFTNTTTYQMGDELRYLEFKLDGKKDRDRISSVEDNEFLQAVLVRAREGAYYQELIRLLTDMEVDDESAAEFVDDLISSDLLHNELLHLPVLGKDYLMHAIDILDRIKVDFQLANKHELVQAQTKLKQLQADLNQFDQQVAEGATNGDFLKKAAQRWFDKEEPEAFPLQVEMFRPLKSSQLDYTIAASVRRALKVANRFSPHGQGEHSNLRRFRNAFLQRFEGREMPLMQALDPESGIAYPNPDTIKAGKLGFIEDVPAGRNQNNGQTPTVRWGEIDAYLFKLCQRAQKEQLHEVEIKDEDIRDLPQDWKTNPWSINAQIALLDRESPIPGKPLIQLKVAGGSCSANLISRFSGLDAQLDEHVQNIPRQEQELQPEVILAEIVHHAKLEHGNFMFRPHLRKYEIPLQAVSLLPPEQQIPVDDLFVSVNGERVILRSKRLNREIVPMLTIPHNFNATFNLGVYRFLCNLQTQNRTAWFNFSWRDTSQLFTFLPRVRYENIILAPAQWYCRKEQVEHMYKLQDRTLQEAIKAFRAEWRIPRYVCIAHPGSDNKLFVDLDNPVFQEVFRKFLRKNPMVHIIESLFPEHEPMLKDEADEGYANEMLVSFVHKVHRPWPKPKRQTESPLPIPRSFAPGSEWLYFKVYLGVNSADEFLTDKLLPLVNHLRKHQLIRQFFFIRYSDPEFHLRIRFRVSDPQHLGQLMYHWHQITGPLVHQDIIKKVQLDTYGREIERYGAKSIELAERIFDLDSGHIIGFLRRQKEHPESETLRWQLGLAIFEDYLTAFGYTGHSRAAFIQRGYDNYFREFSGSKHTLKAINKKYKQHQAAIRDIVNGSQQLWPRPNADYHFFAPPLAETAQLILNLKDQDLLDVDFDEMVWGLIHMSIIRLFPYMNRKFEFVLYALLHKQYSTTAVESKLQKQL